MQEQIIGDTDRPVVGIGIVPGGVCCSTQEPCRLAKQGSHKQTREAKVSAGVKHSDTCAGP